MQANCSVDGRGARSPAPPPYGLIISSGTRCLCACLYNSRLRAQTDTHNIGCAQTEGQYCGAVRVYPAGGEAGKTNDRNQVSLYSALSGRAPSANVQKWPCALHMILLKLCGRASCFARRHDRCICCNVATLHLRKFNFGRAERLLGVILTLEARLRVEYAYRTPVPHGRGASCHCANALASMGAPVVRDSRNVLRARI